MVEEALIKITILLGGLMTAAAYFVLLERRMAAWVQDRIGPNRVGLPLTNIRLAGLGQPLADGLKFILKEEYTPAHVDKRLYILAPIAILAAALTVFAVIPFGSILPAIGNRVDPIHLNVAPGMVVGMNVGLIFVFAVTSIAVYGVILGGWASNNKYSFLGGLRSSAQLIAYELPMGLGLLGVVLAAGSLDLDQIIVAQTGATDLTRGLPSGIWFALAQPLGFVVFVVAAFAEAARLPFDLPEAEQELIGGYHTEYSGMKLLLFLIAEFLHMITASFLIAILFLGGWHLPWITGDPTSQDVTWLTALLRIGVLQAKVFLVILFFMLARWSWPRFRFDQLMKLAWKIMLPLGLVNLVALAALYELRAINDPDGTSWLWGAVVYAGAWLVAVLAWLVTSLANPLVADNRPQLDTMTAEVDTQI
ncbi:MAG TPA: NADH-quinone oxidoreductase subunit NuoH [Pirellulaceae bacterium]|nr:NADH-quinone oxidoreductase subunit NuoH [Pirellulaceae bacterium]